MSTEAKFFQRFVKTFASTQIWSSQTSASKKSTFSVKTGNRIWRQNSKKCKSSLSPTSSTIPTWPDNSSRVSVMFLIIRETKSSSTFRSKKETGSTIREIFRHRILNSFWIIWKSWLSIPDQNWSGLISISSSDSNATIGWRNSSCGNWFEKNLRRKSLAKVDVFRRDFAFFRFLFVTLNNTYSS